MKRLYFKPMKGRCTIITVYSCEPILLDDVLKMFLFYFCLVSLHGD